MKFFSWGSYIYIGGQHTDGGHRGIPVVGSNDEDLRVDESESLCMGMNHSHEQCSSSAYFRHVEFFLSKWLP